MDGNGLETILLAEDEPLVRAMIATALRDRGYNVLEASNGAEALQVAQEHAAGEIQLLLSDIAMPQMNGIELARRFQDIFPDAKIMLMSGFTEEPEVRRTFPDPGIGFLPKPFLLQELAEKVREVLNQ
jgi:two-component system, cell cycle sensor histidine kinase and response regulator CckA